jgi:hypothetical protein
MVIHADATADPLPTPTVVQRLPAATFEQQVATSQAAAVSKYPSLGVLNSALNVSFRREYGRLRLARSEWFSDAGWPLWLADECDQRVKNPKLPEIDVRAANESAYPSSRSLADASTLSSSPSPTPDYFAGSDPGVPDGQVQVRGYYRKNGTYVQPYTRSAPSR